MCIFTIIWGNSYAHCGLRITALDFFQQLPYNLGQWSPVFLEPGTGFVEDSFSTDGEGRGGSDSLGMMQVHYVYCELYFYWASLVAQLVKNPPAMQETLVRFLGQEDPLEKG